MHHEQVIDLFEVNSCILKQILHELFRLIAQKLGLKGQEFYFKWHKKSIGTKHLRTRTGYDPFYASFD